MPPQPPRVIIIGGGPAGLTAALELTRRSPIKPLVLEALDDVGGISRTVEYKGNRMDIGGHRFFSKSDWVMNWWREIMPLPPSPPAPKELLNHVPAADRVMLLRSRLSRIFFLRKFFDYPISLSARTMANLGLWRLLKIGVTYGWASLFQRKPERHLEDFFVNRFGRELYRTFFKDYTEKVWGVPCDRISPDWGAQRVKGLSITRALLHAVRSLLPKGDTGDVRQKKTDTSLIERFLYPKYGPGQMWRIVRDEVTANGGEVRLGCRVKQLRHDGKRVTHVEWEDADGHLHGAGCDFAISSMPVRELVDAMNPAAPATVGEVANGLIYRDFITVGVLLRKLRPQPAPTPGERRLNLLPDTWIYIQEPDVRIGRLQIFNNWSPALVRDPDTVWLGTEYFCQEGDDLWQLDDEAMGRLATAELAKIGLIDEADVLDFHVVRVPKAYPAYFGTYDRFDEIRQWTDALANLFLVGRNGMHRYNNQDHSMTTAKLAVDAIISGSTDKSPLWSVNLEAEYHEEKQDATK
ncbi:NAD(P)/FAD-dependent oxidoreductase [Azospira restricta]|uniref:NAD(P)/FAD-dependent oxidoreductase n=1 Tax=Azospira restricta TaxID=404405 RepID=A0A974SNC1_9RHOO|nr:NAD(P)/FAD-dependent oxidoreductase [Azospira restricta]QRJ63595.1 NAD(P)/FAD-dependent oxidoreductase [Azospira restricta]